MAGRPRYRCHSTRAHLISAYLGIGQSVLKGNETGERATSEDLKEWYGKIQERREEFVTPTIVRALINRLIEYGIVAPPEDGAHAYSVEWPPLAELSEHEVADMQNTRLEALERAVDLGLTRQQRLEFVRDGTLPTEVQTEADDVADMEDVEAAAANARDVEEITAEYEAVADGGDSER